LTGHEAIWHVLIDNKEQGPLTNAEVIEYLRNGTLVGSNLIWRPGFPDWKSINEVDDFWKPPKQASIQTSVQPPTSIGAAPQQEHTPARTNGPTVGVKWSLWKSAWIGLLVSALMLLVQIGGGRGFEIANYAHTASAGTIGNLVGRIISIPLIFVLIALVRNLLNWRQPASNASALRGALIFTVILTCMVGTLAVYGNVFFSSMEIVSGESRKFLVTDLHHVCVQRQRSLGQSVTEAQIDNYCTCLAERVADKTTYKEMGTEPQASTLADLKQRVEVAGYACR
jgi:GYF domain 2